MPHLFEQLGMTEKAASSHCRCYIDKLILNSYLLLLRGASLNHFVCIAHIRSRKESRLLMCLYPFSFRVLMKITKMRQIRKKL